MINLNFFLNLPVSLGQICQVYPPSLAEVLKTPHYNSYLSLFTTSQEDIEDELLGVERNQPPPSYIPTPFEFFLVNCYDNEEVMAIAREAFQFFIHEQVTILPRQKLVIIGDPNKEVVNVASIKDLRIIDENSFFAFQNLIRESVGIDPVEPPRPNEDIRVARIKAKARYRDKIKAKHNKGANLANIAVAICCMDCGISPLNLGELSYVAIIALKDTYQRKEAYEHAIRALLAGADSKKIKPKYWIENS